jgi:hypothetical protein
VTAYARDTLRTATDPGDTPGGDGGAYNRSGRAAPR